MSDLTERFPWGRVIEDFEIGPYTIRKFIWKDIQNSEQSGTIGYSAYINGKDANRSYGTLQAAMIGVISYEAQGPNSQAAELFFRMIEHDAYPNLSAG